MTTDTETPQKARKRAYEAVLGTIERNTGERQGWMMPESAVRVSACSHGSLDVEEYETAYRAAAENGDIVHWHGQVALCDEEHLRGAIVEEAESDHPRKALVADLNKALHDLAGDP